MKFNKLLKSGIGAEETTASLYLRFGELKKQLKIMSQAMNQETEGTQATAAADQAELAAVADQLRTGSCGDLAELVNCQEAARRDLTAEEAAFVSMLNEDLSNFNDFFMDAEEDAIVRLPVLKQRLSAAKSPQQLAAAKQELVLFHGELVLLLHWSTLNVTGLSKILKKHDKVSKGHVQLRASYLANALQQPFYSTDCISDMVEEVEAVLKLPCSTPSVAAGVQAAPAASAASTAASDAAPAAAAADAPPADDGTPAGDSPPVRSAPDSPVRHPAIAASAAAAATSGVYSPGRGRATQAEVLKRTQAALSMWQELGSNAHTPSTVLPASAAASPPKRRRLAQPVEVL